MNNYEQGHAFEVEFAKRLGAKLQPGSGNTPWAKLDLRGRSFLWSLKSTTKQSFRLTTDMLKEMIHAVHGPGGQGGNTMPGMAVRIDGDDYIVMRASDFIALVQSDIRIAQPSKKTEKQKLGNISVFERKLMESNEDGA